MLRKVGKFNLRKFGKFTVPDFIGERYYSKTARIVAVLCALIVSFTYVAGQMRGVGVVFSRFLQVDINTGVIIGMIIVLFYAVLGGMKGITYTQVAQYCVLIFAFMVPAIFISFQMTGNPIPQLGMGSTLNDGSGTYLLEKLNGLSTELGFTEYTNGSKNKVDVFAITLALMVGTAGLPHVIVRFFTVKRVKDARKSAGIALLLIAILYTTAPAVAVFAKTNMINTVSEQPYNEMPPWFKNWEQTGLIKEAIPPRSLATLVRKTLSNWSPTDLTGFNRAKGRLLGLGSRLVPSQELLSQGVTVRGPCDFADQT